MDKMFRIENANDDVRKKVFRVHKKFIVNEHDNSGKTFRSEKTWFKQTNDNDCGPAMILNLLSELNIPLTAANIDDVRLQRNQVRMRNKQRVLQKSDWFFSDDISEYLQTMAGLEVQEFACLSDEQSIVRESVQNNIEDNAYDAIYFTGGRHFRAVVRKNSELYLLDSFKDAPQLITQNQLQNLIEENITSNRPEGPDRIGIVRRKKI